jgi:hypothetical protein
VNVGGTSELATHPAMTLQRIPDWWLGTNGYLQQQRASLDAFNSNMKCALRDLPIALRLKDKVHERAAMLPNCSHLQMVRHLLSAVEGALRTCHSGSPAATLPRLTAVSDAALVHGPASQHFLTRWWSKRRHGSYQTYSSFPPLADAKWGKRVFFSRTSWCNIS